MPNRPNNYSFQRYLLAKRTIDDRALNTHVWNTLHDQLATRHVEGRSLNILEIGGGIGTMIERLLDDGRLHSAHYHLLDEQIANITTAAERLANNLGAQQIQTDRVAHDQVFSVLPSHFLKLENPSRRLDLSLYAVDLFDFLAAAHSLAATDLMIAHAFMDLVNLPTTLPRLVGKLEPGALLYFTINFDGATIFEPAIDPLFDAHIEALYHQTMDERITNGQRSGDSRTGRHLFHQMQTANIQTLDAGSSDWVLFPSGGRYPHDEAYFLHFIINTHYNALREHPELEANRFEAWIDTRHAQVERGELVYIAHQLDYLGEVQASANAGDSIETSRPSR